MTRKDYGRASLLQVQDCGHTRYTSKGVRAAPSHEKLNCIMRPLALVRLKGAMGSVSMDFRLASMPVEVCFRLGFVRTQSAREPGFFGLGERGFFGLGERVRFEGARFSRCQRRVFLAWPFGILIF